MREYDADFDWGVTEVEGFLIVQDPVTRDLLITDYETFVAIYDHENWAVFTHGLDGTRSYRFNGFSAYIYADGKGTWATAAGSIPIMENWVWLEDEEGTWPMPQEVLVEMDMKYGSKLLTLALGLSTTSYTRE